MVFRYSSRLVISVQRYELVRKEPRKNRFFSWLSVECGMWNEIYFQEQVTLYMNTLSQ